MKEDLILIKTYSHSGKTVYAGARFEYFPENKDKGYEAHWAHDTYIIYERYMNFADFKKTSEVTVAEMDEFRKKADERIKQFITG